LVGPEGALTLVDTADSGGSGPPYCGGLTTGQVAVVNVRLSCILSVHLSCADLLENQYGSGTARVIPTATDPLYFSNDSTIVTFPVPTTGTQGVSEPHMAYQYSEELLIPDKVCLRTFHP